MNAGEHLIYLITQDAPKRKRESHRMTEFRSEGKKPKKIESHHVMYIVPALPQTHQYGAGGKRVCKNEKRKELSIYKPDTIRQCRIDRALRPTELGLLVQSPTLRNSCEVKQRGSSRASSHERASSDCDHASDPPPRH